MEWDIKCVLHSRTTNCKMNSKNRHNQDNLLCDLCFTENQDQKHLLKCKVIERKLKRFWIIGEHLDSILLFMNL